MSKQIKRVVTFPSGEEKEINTYEYKLNYILDGNIKPIYDFFQLKPLDPPAPRFQLVSFLNDNFILSDFVGDDDLRRIYYAETQLGNFLKKYNITPGRLSTRYKFLTELEQGLTKNSPSYIPYLSSLPLLEETRKEDFLKRALEWDKKYWAEIKEVRKDMTKEQREGFYENRPCSTIVQFGSTMSGKNVNPGGVKQAINELIFRGGDFSYNCYKYSELLKETGMTDRAYMKQVLPFPDKYYDKFRNYKSYGYRHMNSALRNKYTVDDAELNKYIDEVPPLPKSIYVFRWVTLDNKTLNSYLVNYEYALKGYVSTSLIVYDRPCENDDEKDSSNNTLIRIKIPKGKRVWFFLDPSFESEVLLKHGENYRTVGFKKNVRMLCEEEEKMSKPFNFLDLEMR